jgi:hypothetical protein
LFGGEEAEGFGEACLLIDLPPDWIIRAAKHALNKSGHWTEAMDVFCAYYEVPKVHYLVNSEKVPQKAIACYMPDIGNIEGLCYSKSNEISANTAFHELAHHLNHFLFKTCRLEDKANEAFAEIFAEEMTRKWEGFT